jgi:hypothetical protein
MSTASSERWPRFLHSILLATSLSAAQSAASELIDEALPGGAVIDNDVASLIGEVRRHESLRESPFRAYVLGVLRAVVPWSSAWQKSQLSGNSSEVAVQGAVAEARSFRALSDLCSEIDYLLDDSDAEVRSLTYLLTGGAGVPALKTARDLQRRVAVEVDETARACAVQGVVLALERLPQEDASEFAEWVKGMATDSPLIRARIRVELESVARSTVERHRLEELLSIRGSDGVLGSKIPSLWPAESI